jgi:hypothetical protein
MQSKSFSANADLKFLNEFAASNAGLLRRNFKSAAPAHHDASIGESHVCSTT